MKKFLCAVLMSVSLGTSAQITTYPTGNVNIKRSTEFTMNILSVGEHYHPNWFSSYQNGVHSQVTNASGKFNISLYGDAGNSTEVGGGRAVGVLGVAGFSTSGYNYGVFGRLSGTQSGAGVYGTVVQNMGDFVNGQYAGYFNGATYVDGTLTATSYVTPSDIRLKENIISLEEIDNGSTLDNVLAMNVIEYNYKQKQIPDAEKDTSTVIVDTNLMTERHYGLSAQELQDIYPNLVKEGQDGFLGVNYVELVPILIRSIQELNQKIEDLEGRKAMSGASETNTPVSITGETTKAVLYQNSPNPFSSQTIIRYSLPKSSQNAYIYIFDLQGVLKKQLAVEPSQTQVVINAYDLTPGIYLYSLVAGGQEIVTKRMILSN
jgi:hypothetical protein